MKILIVTKELIKHIESMIKLAKDLKWSPQEWIAQAEKEELDKASSVNYNHKGNTYQHEVSVCQQGQKDNIGGEIRR